MKERTARMRGGDGRPADEEPRTRPAGRARRSGKRRTAPRTIGRRAADGEDAVGGELHLEEEEERPHEEERRCRPSSSGRTDIAKSARRRQMLPRTPGRMPPGCGELRVEADEADQEEDAREAGAREDAEGARERVIVFAAVARPVVFSTASGLPTRLTVRPSSCARRSWDVARDDLDQLLASGPRSPSRRAASVIVLTASSTGRPARSDERSAGAPRRPRSPSSPIVFGRSSPPPPTGEAAPAFVPGRHRGDVADHQDDEARRRRLGARRADPARRPGRARRGSPA